MVSGIIGPAPLVPAHLARDHPLVTRDYSLYTPPIQRMVDQLASWIDNQVEGATIYGPSRFGKSSAVDHWVQTLLSQRYGNTLPMVVWATPTRVARTRWDASMPACYTRASTPWPRPREAR
jgi:hypothetical protein